MGANNDLLDVELSMLCGGYAMSRRSGPRYSTSPSMFPPRTAHRLNIKQAPGGNKRDRRAFIYVWLVAVYARRECQADTQESYKE